MTIRLRSLEYIHGVEPLSAFDDLDIEFLSQIIGKYTSQLSSNQVVSARPLSIIFIGWLGFQDSGWAARPSLKPAVEKTMEKNKQKNSANPTNTTLVHLIYPPLNLRDSCVLIDMSPNPPIQDAYHRQSPALHQ